MYTKKKTQTTFYWDETGCSDPWLDFYSSDTISHEAQNNANKVTANKDLVAGNPNQQGEETLQKEILFISYKMSPDSDLINCSEMEKITSEDIQKVAKKYLSKPFLSITGSRELCSKIKRDWINNFSY